MLAKKTVKNQITLPKAIVDEIPDTDYFEVSLRDGEILLRPVHIEGSSARLTRVRRKIKALGLTEKDIDEAIRWTRSR
jgi:hypothetical protein